MAFITNKERASQIARRTIKIKSLSEYIRTQMGPEDFYEWFRSVAAGVDPDAKEGDFTTPIDMRLRVQCMNVLVNRCFGSVPKHLVLDASITPQRPAWDKLPDDKLKELRQTLSQLKLEAPKDNK